MPDHRAAASGLYDVRHYRREWLRGDLLAGVTVAAYLVPQVMAYAGVAGLPPVVGLWTAIPAMAVYVVAGSSRQLSVGPESTTALMSAAAIAPLVAGDPARYAALIAALAGLVGLSCVIGWAVRLGFVADLLSRPVLIGYMAGVAVLMIIGQLQRTTGVSVHGDTLLGQVASFARHLRTVEWPTVALAAAVVAFLVVLRVRLPRWPGPLIAVALAATVVAVFGLREHGIAVVGAVPDGVPVPRLPDVSPADLRDLVLPALGIAVVGFTDNVLTGRAFAARGGYEIDANRELLSLGVANVGVGLMQGFPVSSSGSRSALGVSAGSRTQLFSVVALVSVVVVLLVGGGVLADFPQAALGAIIVYAATRLVDVAEFRRLARFRRSEFLLAVAATAGVLVVDILYGVVIAVSLSVADLLRRVARPHDAVLGRVPGLAGMHDVADYPAAATVAGLLVYRYDSPLFFANAEDFKRRAMGAVDTTPGVCWFVLNVEAIVEVDITGLDAVEWLRANLTGRGIVFAMARVKQDLLADLRAYGLTDSIGADRLYPTLPTALAAFERATGA